MTAQAPDDPVPSPAQADPWAAARRFTPARIGLGQTGASLPTGALLALRLAHARARDAVHDRLDAARLGAEVVTVASAAEDRQAYLLRPDLGRRLAPAAAAALAARRGAFDLAPVIADGLSARAVQAHAVPVLTAVLAALSARGWSAAPLVAVQQGRVAIGDAVATALGATAALVLIGERPGLSAADSMGAYVTWRPGPATTDADRNCVSNIRPEGLSYADAARRIVFLLTEMRACGFSGVRLKADAAAAPVLPDPAGH